MSAGGPPIRGAAGAGARSGAHVAETAGEMAGETAPPAAPARARSPRASADPVPAAEIVPAAEAMPAVEVTPVPEPMAVASPVTVAVPRPSASLILLRPDPSGAPGLQVLLLTRAERAGDPNGGMAVFPGGVIDAVDALELDPAAAAPQASRVADGADAADAQVPAAEAAATATATDDEADVADVAATVRPASAHPGGPVVPALRAAARAALRECAEECGLWLGLPPCPAPALSSAPAVIDVPDVPDAPDATSVATTPTTPATLPPVDPARAEPLRRALLAGAIDAPSAWRALGLRPAVEALHHVAHWITPAGVSRRFDTRFFLADGRSLGTPVVDGREIVGAAWWRPADALAPGSGLALLHVTRVLLARLADCADVAAAYAWAASLQPVPCTEPRRARDGADRPTVISPGHPAWAEVGRIDPAGQLRARVVLRAGEPVWLSPRVLRVTAPNPGPMTGPGTNSYFVGSPDGQDWALIDPGPHDAAHLRALQAAAPGPLRWILATHSHADHSPAARALQAACGAPTAGRLALHAQGQDPHWRPDRVLVDGERLALGPQATLRVLHTPGHASNHLCFVLEEERLLFSGDHLMQGSTVVIAPPDGDMAQYLASLRRLLDEPLDWLAPAHGFLVAAPHALARRVIDHRLAREAKVLAAVRALAAEDDGARPPPGARASSAAVTEDALLAQVYADTPAALHPVARKSLLAHLLKLQAEGRLRSDGPARWRPEPSAAPLAAPDRPSDRASG